MSLVRQNYHEESEAGVNAQVNVELYTYYTYLSMVSQYYRRLNIIGGALLGDCMPQIINIVLKH